MTQNGNVENNMSHFNQIFPFNKNSMKSLILYFNLYEVFFCFQTKMTLFCLANVTGAVKIAGIEWSV